MPLLAGVPVKIPIGDLRLEGELDVPPGTVAMVVFAHGSGSSRLSPRSRHVAEMLQDAGLGTLLFDLLTPREEEHDQRQGKHRFDIDLLAGRLVAATQWLVKQPRTHRLPVGYFGASTGAAAAIRAAADLPDRVRAVVSRGGRPDLAGGALERLQAPTLLIVGGDDEPVIRLNKEAATRIDATKRLCIVPRATHLFEEPGALDAVARLARDWFVSHLAAPS